MSLNAQIKCLVEFEFGHAASDVSQECGVLQMHWTEGSYLGYSERIVDFKILEMLANRRLYHQLRF